MRLSEPKADLHKLYDVSDEVSSDGEDLLGEDTPAEDSSNEPNEPEIQEEESLSESWETTEKARQGYSSWIVNKDRESNSEYCM